MNAELWKKRKRSQQNQFSEVPVTLLCSSVCFHSNMFLNCCLNALKDILQVFFFFFSGVKKDNEVFVAVDGRKHLKCLVSYNTVLMKTN